MNPSKCPRRASNPAPSSTVRRGHYGGFILRASLILAGGVLVAIAHAQSNYSTPYYFTTIAGSVGTTGTADGTGNAARFNTPVGIAVSKDGTAYVADMNSHTIRKITPVGAVSTLAGQPGVSGPSTVNGTGGAARFNLPQGVAVDAAGNVYVGDTSNHAIRKISPAGVVTTLAGGTAGAVNGIGTAARLFSPNGVAVDNDGNVYVADTANHAIRKITPGGVVTTLAGLLGTFGSVDGVGPAARFNSPRGVAVDGRGTVYVADRDNNSIRSIWPDGQVTTIAGNLSFNPGSADGPDTSATFNQPYSVAVDANYVLYVAEAGNHTIRKIQFLLTPSPTPGGPSLSGYFLTSTLAGAPGVPVGSTTDVRGSAVRFGEVRGVAVDGDGNLYATDTTNHTIRMSVFPPAFTLHPVSQTIQPGGTLLFTAAAKSNVPIFGVSWEQNSTPGFLPHIATWNPGLTAMTTELLQTNVVASQLGTYTVIATNMAGSTRSNIATLAFPVSTAGRLINLSILTSVPTAGDSFTMGYVVGGSGTTGTKPLVIRAVGPSLIPLGVSGTLNDPKIELFAGATKTTENDNWGGAAAISTAMTGVGAFAFTGPASLDAAVVASITTQDNSVKVSAAGTGTGTVIAEIYDATPSATFFATTPRLVNVSVLKDLGTGLTAGFVIGGAQSKTVLIRAVGPTLGTAPFNVAGVVADPQLTLFSGQTSIGTNDNWGGTAALTAAFGQVGAFALPAASRDAALLATLQPGNYTVQVSGVAGTTGVAIVEVYEVP